MSPTTGLLLGLIQGLTEFLPVSSSGHLILAEKLLGLPPVPAGFLVFVRLATLLAAILALRPELIQILAFLASSLGIRWVSIRSDGLREGRRLFVALVIGTIPAAAAGLLFRAQIDAFLAGPRFIGFALLFTGAVLLGTRFAPRGGSPVDAGSALAIGLSQALSLVPGVSRSGMTMAAGLYSGVKREKVVRFSFLLALPAIVGSSLVELREGATLAGMAPATLILSFLAALISGWIAIQVMLRVVISGRLGLFGIYCIAAGVAALLLLPPASF